MAGSLLAGKQTVGLQPCACPLFLRGDRYISNKNVSRGTFLLLRPIHFKQKLIIGFQEGYVLGLKG